MKDVKIWLIKSNKYIKMFVVEFMVFYIIIEFDLWVIISFRILWL